MSRSVVIYDTEYTTWEGALQNDWGEAWQHREIVQIAAIRLDLATMTETGAFDVLIKPQRNPQLSQYFINLTGITQEEVDARGLSFPDAFHLFTAFIGGLPAAAYGDDAKIIRENLALCGMPSAEEGFDALDIAPWLHLHGAAYGVRKGVNSGRLAATVGAPIASRNEHNALHDARSVAAAYKFLLEKGAKAFF